VTIEITLEDVLRARQRIASQVRRTPLVKSEWLSRLTGGGVYLKLESLQVTGSFKFRGALNAVLALEEKRRTGVRARRLVTASAGNHGRGLAWAARTSSPPVVVFTPRNAPATKLDAIRDLGADLRAVADDYEGAERLAKEFADDTGAMYLSPYSHPDLIAATGTIALEVLEDLQDVDRIVVPVGGGGLIAGIAIALHALRPDAAVVGAEVEASHAFTASLAAGRIVEVPVGPTLADGLAGNMDPENIAFPIVQRHVDRVELVREERLGEAIRGLVQHEHLLAEGAGAAGVAALLGSTLPDAGGSTVVIVSGANIDTGRLIEVLGPQS
jgi:threonine dehydratase